MSTPTRTELLAEAGRLRSQAAGLTRRQADHTENHVAEVGGRLDAATREATAARAAVTATTAQANDLHDKAQLTLEYAGRLEAEARKLSESPEVADNQKADELLEQAALQRGTATGFTRRAAVAEQESRRQLDLADAAERRSTQLRREEYDRYYERSALGAPVDQMEAKAATLERAASQLRQASTATDPTTRATHTAAAETLVAEAARIVPDLSGVTVDDAIAAGIPVSQIPGAELMPLPPPEPVPFVNDTLLMDPTTGAFHDPVLAPAGRVPLDDTDLMTPEPDPVDPQGSLTPAAQHAEPLDVVDDPFAAAPPLPDTGSFADAGAVAPAPAEIASAGTEPIDPSATYSDTYDEPAGAGAPSDVDAHGDTAREGADAWS